MASIDQIVSWIKVRISRQADTSLDAKIVLELQAAQESLEEGITLPRCLVIQDKFTVSGAHESFSLHNFTGFIRTCDDEFGLRVADATQPEPYLKLVKQDTYAKLLQYGAGTADESTFPTTYCLLGNIAHIRLKQVVEREYWLSYYKKDPTVPAVGATTLWSTYYSGLLMAVAGIEVARSLRDSENVKYFTALRNHKYREMVNGAQAEEDADQNYVMGE